MPGQIPFVLPKQQHQSTESTHYQVLYKCPVYLLFTSFVQNTFIVAFYSSVNLCSCYTAGCEYRGCWRRFKIVLPRWNVCSWSRVGRSPSWSSMLYER